MSSSPTIAAHLTGILEQLGEDPQREGLYKTPERAAKALRDLTAGYHQDLNVLINDALFSSDVKEMIIIKDIHFFSLCEHHLLPFFGHCHIGYIPNGKVLGLSKFARVVDHFSKRLQIQEHLGKEIATSLMEITGAEGVGVVIEAQHLCMMMRGVEKQGSKASSSMLLGSFRHNAKTRHEFLSLIHR